MLEFNNKGAEEINRTEDFLIKLESLKVRAALM